MADEVQLKQEVQDIISSKSYQELKTWQYPDEILEGECARLFEILITANFGTSTATVWSKLRQAREAEDEEQRRVLIREINAVEKGAECTHEKLYLQEKASQAEIQEEYKEFHENALNLTGSEFNSMIADITDKLKRKK